MPQLAEVTTGLDELDQHLDQAHIEMLWEGSEASELPAAVRVQDLPEEAEVQHKFAEGLGKVAVGEVIAKPSTNSIVENMERAAKGDRGALERDAHLALVEAILAEGVAEVVIERDEDGRLSQHGAPLEDMAENTIRLRPGNHPELHKVSRTEGLSIQAWDTYDQKGYFDDGYVWVVPRMVPVGVPAAALRNYGYFENLAVAWGVIWKQADGTFMMRSVFVAGTTAFDSEENATRAMTPAELDLMMESRLARRHDLAAVAGIYESLGMPVPEDITGFQRGFLMHNSQFQNEGHYEADVARWYDEQLGPGYFFGKQAESSDYVEYSQKSLDGMSNLDARKDAVVEELLRHRTEGMDRMVAAKLLARIARHHAIEYIIENPEADARPLGVAAMHEVAIYRHHVAQGNMVAAELSRQSIHRKARVNMCGFGDEEAYRAEADKDKTADSEETSGETGASDSCLYRHSNCYCCPYDNSGNTLNEPKPVWAERDNRGVARCLRVGCEAILATVYDAQGRPVGSKVISKGKIFQLAQDKAAKVSGSEDADPQEA